MDTIIHKIIGLSKPEDTKDLCQFLSGQIARFKQIKEEDMFTYLAQLTPEDHCVGYIYMLEGLARGAELNNLRAFGGLANNLLLRGPPSLIIQEKKRVYKIATQFAEVCRMETPMAGIFPLEIAIAKITRSSPNLLTPLHKDHILLCILAKCYDTAYKSTMVPKYELEPRTKGMSIQDYLLYYYYSGVVCCVLKKFKDALFYLQTVLTAPSDGAVSQIQVEAFKKYTLVSLLEFSEVKQMPKQSMASNTLSKFRNTVGPAYSSLKKGNIKSEGLKKAIIAGKRYFEEDDNWGLAKQVLAAETTKAIKNLTKTYSSLSFADIAELTGLKDEKEAEDKLAYMIEDGEIKATISAKDKIVIFVQDEPGKEQKLAVQLKDKIQEAFYLSAKIKELNIKIQSNIAFIKRKRTQKARNELNPTTFGRGHSGSHPVDEQLRQAIERSRYEQ